MYKTMVNRIVLSLMLVLISSIILNIQYFNSGSNSISVFASTAIGSEEDMEAGNEEEEESGQETSSEESNKTRLNQSEEETSKPSVAKKVTAKLELSVPELKKIQPPASSLTPPYKVKVTFDSITVHNSHEGILSGDGEYDLSAYVHGKLVSLTDLSRSAGGSGLWDVSSGEKVNFPPGSEIIVDIDKALPLSIITVGSEVDGCDRTAFPSDIQSKIISVLEKGVNYLIPLGDIQDELDRAINWVGCKLNANDDIGDIVKAYDPTSYGAGPHSDKSDKQDFTLRYTVSVSAPLPPPCPPRTIYEPIDGVCLPVKGDTNVTNNGDVVIPERLPANGNESEEPLEIVPNSFIIQLKRPNEGALSFKSAQGPALDKTFSDVSKDIVRSGGKVSGVLKHLGMLYVEFDPGLPVNNATDSRDAMQADSSISSKSELDQLSSLNKLKESLEANPDVEAVYPDVVMSIDAQLIPDGQNRIDADTGPAKSGDGSGMIDVDIAILDTGVQADHPDLNVFKCLSFVGNPTNGSPRNNCTDDHGHGTHVAGIAAALDNDFGVVGTAPGARIWAIKVLGDLGEGSTTDILEGLNYVASHSDEIDVINLSLGAYYPSWYLGIFGAAGQGAVTDLVNDHGVVAVAAAGNDHKDARNFVPARTPEAITVSAMADSDGKCGGGGGTEDDTFATFSNYGKVIDLAAPGVDIISTYKGGDYALMSGTSMATPHVAGAAALYLSLNPSATPTQVVNYLKSTGIKSPTITTLEECDGNGRGYFEANDDGDQIREPFLYLGLKPSVCPPYCENIHIVPVNLNNDGITDLLFYNRVANTGKFYTVSPSGDITLVKTHTNWRSTWSNIIPVNVGVKGLLFYDPSANTGEFYTVSPSGDITLVKTHTNWRSTWSNIIPVNLGGQGLLFFSLFEGTGSFGGKAQFYTVSPSGEINLVKSHKNWHSRLSNIIPVNLNNDGITDLLFYSPSTNTGVFWKVSFNGDISLVNGYTNWRSTWTNIIPVNLNNDGITDLLFYSRSGHIGQFYTVSPSGDITLVKSYTNWRSTWTNIIPVNLNNDGITDLLFYSSGHIGEFYKGSPSGDITLVKSYTN
jgi:subtilisin family serine protease